MARFYKNRSRMLKHRAIRRGAAGLARLKGRRKSGVSLAVKKYVSRTIHRDQENKQTNIQTSDNFGSITENSAMNMYPVMPYIGYSTISQGVTQNTRIGNEIKIRKVMLKYVIYPNAYNVTTNTSPIPMEIDMFLGYVKQTPGYIPQAIDIQSLFQSGSTSFTPTGNLTDLIAQPNNDYWCIKKRWGHKVGFSTATGTGSVAGHQYFANNDFKYNVVRKMDITKFCPKTLKFNDSLNTLQGKGLFFFYQAVRADGLGWASTQLPAHIDYWIDTIYEDA